MTNIKEMDIVLFMKNLLNKLKCTLFGHVQFNSGSEPVRFIQPKSVGNKTMTIVICERCHAVTVTPGQLSQAELEAEKVLEEKYARMALELKETQEKTIKELTKLSIDRNGKSAFN